MSGKMNGKILRLAPSDADSDGLSGRFDDEGGWEEFKRGLRDYFDANAHKYGGEATRQKINTQRYNAAQAALRARKP